MLLESNLQTTKMILGFAKVSYVFPLVCLYFVWEGVTPNRGLGVSIVFLVYLSPCYLPLLKKVKGEYRKKRTLRE